MSTPFGPQDKSGILNKISEKFYHWGVNLKIKNKNFVFSNGKQWG
jgi:hypothetical protein